MNHDQLFNEVFNECLDKVLHGESIDTCLQRHPEHAEQLAPLLRTALSARAASTVNPRPEFKSRARAEFQAALREMESRKSHRKFNWGFSWRPQLRLQTGWAVGLAASLVIVLGGGSTVAAASYSMPDEALYSLKLATENAQLAVTPSEVGKAELNAKFASRRTSEIEYLANKGDAQEVQNIASLLTTNLENITSLTGKGTASADAVTAGASQDTFGAVPPVVNAQPSMMEVPSSPVAATPPAPAAVPPPNGSPAVTGEPASTGAVKSTQTVPATQVPQAVSNTTPDASRSVMESNNRDLSEVNMLSPAAREEIRKIIEENYLELKARLEALLERASAGMRPAIRQALAKSEAEYIKAIRNLDIAASLDQ